MRSSRRFESLALTLSLIVALSAPLGAASYEGRNVDDRRYHASIVNYDYGAYENVEVRFQGDHAFVYFAGGGKLVLILREEEIIDPHEILADDPLRGVIWEIDVKDLVAH